MNELKPCPFCGGEVLIMVCDDEGNIHTWDYEYDPWSGLAYCLWHSQVENLTNECPIAGHEGEGKMGVWLYESRDEAAEAWNRRTNIG